MRKNVPKPNSEMKSKMPEVGRVMEQRRTERRKGDFAATKRAKTPQTSTIVHQREPAQV